MDDVDKRTPEALRAVKARGNNTVAEIGEPQPLRGRRRE